MGWGGGVVLVKGSVYMYMDPGRQCRQIERERETDRQTDRHRERQRVTETERQRDRGLKERWTHMYDKQIQLKSDTPFRLSRLPKSGSARAVKMLQNRCIYLCLFLDREIPLFCQESNARGVENPKPTGHRMTPALSV